MSFVVVIVWKTVAASNGDYFQLKSSLIWCKYLIGKIGLFWAMHPDKLNIYCYLNVKERCINSFNTLKHGLITHSSIPLCIMPLCIMPLCIMPLCIMPLCIMPLCIMPLCIMPLCITTLSILTLCHYAECHCSDCCHLFTVMLSVVMLNVITLSVVAPEEQYCSEIFWKHKYFFADWLKKKITCSKRFEAPLHSPYHLLDEVILNFHSHYIKICTLWLYRGGGAKGQ